MMMVESIWWWYVWTIHVRFLDKRSSEYRRNCLFFYFLIVFLCAQNIVLGLCIDYKNNWTTSTNENVMVSICNDDKVLIIECLPHANTNNFPPINFEFVMTWIVAKILIECNEEALEFYWYIFLQA